MLQVGFYKHGLDFFDRAIRLWTWSKYSHCELRFSDGWSYSSFPDIGTSFFKHSCEDPWHWDYIDVLENKPLEQKVRAFCDAEAGLKYDWKGIVLSQVLGLNRSAPNEWFCSEVCTAALQQIGLFSRVVPHKVSPKGLYQLVSKR